MTDQASLKLVIVSDYSIVQECVGYFLDASKRFDVKLDGLHYSTRSSEDVDVVFCISDPSPDLESLLLSAKGRYPNAKIACLLLGGDDTAVLTALRSGVTGIIDDVLGACSAGDVVDQLVRVARGEFVVSAAQATRLAHFHVSGLSALPIDRAEWLTQREQEVLGLLAQGSSNKVIAARLSVSEHTVRAHLRGIMQKLQVSNRVQAAAMAWRSNIVQGQQREETKWRS